MSAGAEMRLVKFTDPMGHPVWIEVSAIIRVAPALGTETPGAKTVLTLVGGHQSVKESPELVVSFLNEGRGRA